MTIAFWIVAGLGTLVFLAAGGMKLARDRAALKEANMPWVDDFSAGPIKLIGLAEVLGALGLILPALTDTATVLSPIAGICLALVMLGAVKVHTRRKESPAAPAVLAVLTLTAAVLGFAAL
ncbi:MULTISPECIES: DoxX family protein [unclassified Streptomyces]|uniref:DoxX family protein n=1 Tax=unclassified Streptomyces TaxID=2593676 RepID=UPI0033182F11